MPKGASKTGRQALSGAEEFEDLVRMFDISLKARGRSEGTRDFYRWALDRLGRFLVGKGMPTDPGKITREHLETFLAQLGDEASPRTEKTLSKASRAGVYRSMHAFFEWLIEAEEIVRSPMERMKPPATQKAPPQVIGEEAIARLLEVCRKGKDFQARRDYALLVLLLDTGCRRGEMAGVRISDIDWDDQLIRVVGKGDKVREVPFGNQAALVLRQYIRVRRQYPGASSDYLWLGREGPLLGNSMLQMVKRRARQAGIDGKVWVHLFRHSWAHYFLEAGGQRGDLKRLGGWDSDEMVDWYGSSEADRRAQKAHREFSPADRLMGEKRRKK